MSGGAGDPPGDLLQLLSEADPFRRIHVDRQPRPGPHGGAPIPIPGHALARRRFSVVGSSPVVRTALFGADSRSGESLQLAVLPAAARPSRENSVGRVSLVLCRDAFSRWA